MYNEQHERKKATSVAIHQPNFLPWIGYFYKILKSDMFVFLDNVQFTKNSYINRSKIKTSQGELWLTIPVLHQFGQSISQAKINNSFDWRKKHLKTIELNYKKAPFFNEVYELIKGVYYDSDWHYIANLNVELTLKICEYLKIKTRFIRASDLKVQGKATDLLISIVKSLNCEIYISGFGGAKYQDEELFRRSGINLIYYDFQHPIYNQLYGEFIPNLSIIDLLFNLGKDSFIKISESRLYKEEEK